MTLQRFDAPEPLSHDRRLTGLSHLRILVRRFNAYRASSAPARRARMWSAMAMITQALRGPPPDPQRLRALVCRHR